MPTDDEARKVLQSILSIGISANASTNTGTVANESDLNYSKLMETIEKAIADLPPAPPRLKFPGLLYQGGIAGMPIYTSPHLPIYEKRTITVKRSWRERLFSRPWRPWMKMKEIEVEDPERPAVWMINERLWCNPAVKAQVANLYRHFPST